jgi:hypothetical protein
MEMRFLNEKSATAYHPYDSLVCHVSVFIKVVLYRRSSLERCSQLTVAPFSGNGTIYFYFVANS